MDKQSQMRDLISDMSKDLDSIKIFKTKKSQKVDLSLINQFAKLDHIPNKWFDWVRSANAQRVIIGQDWGPFSVLKDITSDFDPSRADEKEYYHDFLFKDFSSRTEKFIFKALNETYEAAHNRKVSPEEWEDIMFTMAVLFTRQGDKFRGTDNFAPKESAQISYPYFKRQLDIVSPTTVMCLGGMAMDCANQYYQLGLDGMKITHIVEESRPKGYFEKDGVRIIPNFHPAAHVPPSEMMKQWELFWG